MKGFNFEKNLNHQSHAVDSTIGVFLNIPLVQPTEADKNYINPVFDFQTGNTYPNNIRTIRENNGGISERIKRDSNIIDIMMETGTGKTYTYTKTIFELNKQYGIFKFIVVVPTLSIKAGTIDFLKSDSSREHFKEQYGKTLHLHVVESLKNSKSKKSYIPPAVTSFVNSGNFEKNSIQVLIINAGMINSETMQKSFDKGLFDKYTVPFDAIGATKPFMIIDEPHKFGTGNKTWENIQKMKPQFILRYGATFQGYENLIYTLTAVDSFNRNLVKGVIGHITEFDSGKNAIVKFIDSDGTEASFELNENDKRKTLKLKKKDSLQTVHSEMSDLSIENLNKSTVVLSNGLEMKKGDKINPYSYAEKLQETMIQKAIRKHFELEKEFLTRDVKIKPLTLFFIDNIDEYRNKDGYIKKTVEQLAKAEIENLLKVEQDVYYKAFLEKSLIDISATHGGYFSKDNSEKDEVIEKEINEILHDKQEMLSLENPRRFIFSKWTLREGWDNPNVFQICKLRSSGSEISKLQEVGRGLRLPVNEYGNRVKDEQFYLNYFVDFTESKFVDDLVKEINDKSGAISIEQTPDKLSAEMIKKICELYDTNEEDLLQLLDDNDVIKRNNDFKANGFTYIKHNYPKIFEGVNSTKVRKATDDKKKITIRTDKYSELKDLWEKLNEKVILEYKFDKEAEFKSLFTEFLKAQKGNFTIDGVSERVAKVEIKDDRAIVNEAESIYGRNVATISTMKYSDFLKELSKILNINLTTIHQSIIDAGTDINKHLNPTTLRIIKDKFDHFLMANAIDKFSIEYKKVSNNIHPTKLTDENGNALSEISASDIGIFFSDEDVAQSYFFDELYYDSELEMKNIKTEINEVIVFTKIPKNSIKIPVAGGKTYSPDFAYVLKFKDGKQKLNFIVETKDVGSDDGLREEEKAKIKHAEKFFGGQVKIEFKTQFTNNKIVDLIKEIAIIE
ncbi:MAG: type III restriction-modification system endonuclease [Bacteroidetes bacterium]|nr:type III restriction-modification system endonuclease [Bacteroidota bacterium]MCB0605581.1 type III restriction-modification system endonuclease [Saprospiraceae bacterium]